LTAHTHTQSKPEAKRQDRQSLV